jgi:hypothetical protein
LEVFKFIESIENPECHFQVMNPDILCDKTHKVLLEVLLPKLMLEFSIEVVL